jgi:hypothetical protein
MWSSDPNQVLSTVRLFSSLAGLATIFTWLYPRKQQKGRLQISVTDLNQQIRKQSLTSIASRNPQRIIMTLEKIQDSVEVSLQQLNQELARLLSKK